MAIGASGVLSAAGGMGGYGPSLQMNDYWYGGKGGGGVIYIKATTLTKAGTFDVSGANPGIVIQPYDIGGHRYIDAGGIETLAVPFTPADGAVSSGNYHGFVRLNVSGSGVSCTPATNDAFYIWNWLSGCGNPNTVPQHDFNWYQLTFGTQPLNLEPWLPSRDATQFIYYDIDGTGAVLSRPYVPAYRTDHTVQLHCGHQSRDAGPVALRRVGWPFWGQLGCLPESGSRNSRWRSH